MTDIVLELPSELSMPAGADGWRDMYPWYRLFIEERKDTDNQLFWFRDEVHAPNVLHPYDAIVSECFWNAFSRRVFVIPDVPPVDIRILHGHLYLALKPRETHQAETPLTEEFWSRADCYYRDWDRAVEAWKARVLKVIGEMRSLRFTSLPAIESVPNDDQQSGITCGYALMRNYERLILALREVYQYHFELLTLSQAAQLAFSQFCQLNLKGFAPDNVRSMVTARPRQVDRPLTLLRELAVLAFDLNLTERFQTHDDPGKLFQSLLTDERGRKWLTAWEGVVDPWFFVSTDPGHPGGTHVYGTWADDPAIPLGTVRRNLQHMVAHGTTPDVQPESDRGAAYELVDAARLVLDEANTEVFERLLDLAQKGSAFTEEHTLYVEHWAGAAFWMQSRQLSDALVVMGLLSDREDMYFLRSDEVRELLADAVARWSVGETDAVIEHWRPLIEKRRRIYDVLQAARPPLAVGLLPVALHPAVSGRWGITLARLERDTANKSGQTPSCEDLLGLVASEGIVEGRARVISEASQLNSFLEGEVLVCHALSPAWSHAFDRIAAVVTDVGGVSCHAAVVCREYGLPAVVGTAIASSLIATGQFVRVDGYLGTVTLL
jgi:pyruvate,water dikinase